MPSFLPISVSKLLIAFSMSAVVGFNPGSGNAPQMQGAFAGDAVALSEPTIWGSASAPAPAAVYFRKSRLETRMRCPPAVDSPGPKPSDTDPLHPLRARVLLEATRMVTIP